MTPSNTPFRLHWVVFGHNTDDSAERIHDLLRSEGITPAEYVIYGTTRAILQNMGLPVNTSQVFHGGYHVGDLEALKTQLYTLKRIHGEI